VSGRDRPDHYSVRARKEGYAARSVYKLREIQDRYHVLPTGGRILDIGASPGSWTQYALSVVGDAGRVVAVDLKEITAPGLAGDRRLIMVEGDIFDSSTLDVLARHGPYDAIISDAAPATTGNRAVDTARSAGLVEQVLFMCGKLMTTGGALVAKVFKRGEEQGLLRRVRSDFNSGRLVKPRASRAKSFEVFVVGTGYNPT
jgi:23S rRNA (uridine2552-2'-O)-methyltransferase